MIFDFNQKDFLFDAQEQSRKWVENWTFGSCCLPLPALCWRKGFYQHKEDLKGAAFFFFFKEKFPPCSKGSCTIHNWKSDVIIGWWCWQSDCDDPCRVYYIHMYVIPWELGWARILELGKLSLERWRGLACHHAASTWWPQDSRIHFPSLKCMHFPGVTLESAV